MKDAALLGSSLAEVFGSPDYDCSVLDAEQKPEFAITRLRSGPSGMEKAPAYPPENAVLICVSLTPSSVGQWRALYGGHEVGVTRAIPFATTYIDLNVPMEMWVRGPFDYLHYYLSINLLRRIALENGIAPNFELQEVFFVEDLVVAEITKSILAPISHQEPLDRLALDQLSLILGAHTLQVRCGEPPFSHPQSNSLEPWQKLRAEEMLRAHIEGNITVKQLSDACSLSETHFARRFRTTFGISVHQRLIQMRIEHAKELLSDTEQPLGEVALKCGFCDQAAFTRTFTRSEHLSPSHWRRANRDGCDDLKGR